MSGNIQRLAEILYPGKASKLPENAGLVGSLYFSWLLIMYLVEESNRD